MSRDTSNDNQVATRKCHAVVEVDVPDEAEMETQTVVINFDDVKDSNNNNEQEGSTEEKNMLKLCPTCNKETSNITGHMGLHEKWGAIHKCELCPREYGRKSHLSRHMKLHATCPKPHVCSICNKGFNYKQYLKIHQRLHTGEKPHLCEVCGSSFSDPSTLRKHRRVHNKGEIQAINGKYVCQICGKVLCSQFALQLHLARRDEHCLCACSICGQKIMKSQLSRHILTMHNVHERFVCNHPGCVRRYHSATGLRYHMFSHSGKIPYPCKLCNKGFRMPGDLKKHEKCHEAWERMMFRFEKCGNVVHRRRKLKNNDPGLAKLCGTCKVAAKKRAAKKCLRCGAVIRTGISKNQEVCRPCENMEGVQKIVSGKSVKYGKLFILEKVDPNAKRNFYFKPDDPRISLVYIEPQLSAINDKTTRTLKQKVDAVKKEQLLIGNEEVSGTKEEPCMDIANVERSNDKATQMSMQKVVVVKEELIPNENVDDSRTKEELCEDMANIQRTNTTTLQMTEPFEIKENPFAEEPTSSFLINVEHSYALVNF